MMTPAFRSWRPTALVDARPATLPAWAGAEPCPGSHFPLANLFAMYEPLHVETERVKKDGFDSREIRGTQLKFLTRKVPA